jgi:4-amino-4-deoxy-L-arabinose transferase-like glycosyltransferase
MEIMSKTVNYPAVLLVLLLALAARLYIWIDFLGKPEFFVQPDTMSYLHPGMQLIEKGNFPSFSRTPVYPIFLALINTYISSSHAAAALMQIVLSVFTVWMMYLIALRTFGFFAAILCGFFLALDFQSALTANFLLSETLFTTILAIFLLRIVAWHQEGNKHAARNLTNAAISGILLSLLSLCRPVAFLLFVPVAFWIVSVFKSSKKKIAIIAICFSLAAMSMPMLWTVRNHKHAGVYFFTTISAKGIFLYRAAWNVAFLEKKEFAEVHNAFKQQAEEKKEKEHWNDGELARWEKNEGLKIIAHSLPATVWQGLNGLAEIYFEPKALCQLDRKNILSPASVIILWRMLHLFIIYAGCVIALILVIKNKYKLHEKHILLLLFLIAAYFSLLSAGAEAYGRFRVPIAPALSLIAASGWGYLFNRSKSKF